MLFAVLSGFVLAFFAPWIVGFTGRRCGWVLALLPAILFIFFCSYAGRVSMGEEIASSTAWLPALDVQLSFHLDGLSLLFALLITFIGALVLIYSGSYLDTHPHVGRFFFYILFFMASMLGLVLADNVIALFVFWELTSISSYFLIGFQHERAKARYAALQALLVTTLGGLALLAGLLLAGSISDSFELSTILHRGAVLRSHYLYPPVLMLVLAGAFSKSAQVPFHFWLPNAMEAPTPVSTYLHSATMVKAGVYILARLSPALGGTWLWEGIISPFGAVTMLAGAYLALVHTDLKRILAYTTVSALGMMTLMLGMGSTVAVQACVVFLVAHAFYKGALFLVAGTIDHVTGTRDAERLGGLWKTMPIIAVAAVFAALSSAGIPPFLGFIGKEMVYKAVFGESIKKVWLGVMFLTNVGFVAVAALVGFRPFFGKTMNFPRTPHKPAFSLWLGPLVLAMMGILIGVHPHFIVKWVLAPAAAAIEQQPPSMEVALWHGFHYGLVWSAAAFVIGIGLFFTRRLFRKVAQRLDSSERVGPARWYNIIVDGMLDLARLQTRILQNGHLHLYLLIIVSTTVALVGSTLLNRPVPLDLSRWASVNLYELVPAVLILFATALAVRSYALITAVVALGVVGFGVALIFLLFSAPDLAMTQFAIEVLSVVLLVLVLFRLPEIRKYSKPVERLRDALPALATGALMTLLVLTVTAIPRESRLSSYFAEHSLLDAKGGNIVNVILVDFRGLDTMGEITVLAVAAIGVYSLLKLYSKEPGQSEDNE